MKNLTPEGARRLEDAAMRHGVSLDAVSVLLDALAQGNGSQAQFNHPDLGGMGQWSEGGMIMVGDMFNHGLKHRVDALCNELAGILREQPMSAEDAAHRSDAAGQWWPSGLGSRASIGAQNDLKYAYFPCSSRLVILQDRQVRIYDTGEHRIVNLSALEASTPASLPKMPVTIAPGEMLLTRIPVSPSSAAVERVNARTAPFEAV
jgi:hypothetical protein